MRPPSPVTASSSEDEDELTLRDDGAAASADLPGLPAPLRWRPRPPVPPAAGAPPTAPRTATRRRRSAPTRRSGPGPPRLLRRPPLHRGRVPTHPPDEGGAAPALPLRRVSPVTDPSPTAAHPGAHRRRPAATRRSGAGPPPLSPATPLRRGRGRTHPPHDGVADPPALPSRSGGRSLSPTHRRRPRTQAPIAGGRPLRGGPDPGRTRLVRQPPLFVEDEDELTLRTRE